LKIREENTKGRRELRRRKLSRKEEKRKKRRWS
jgi:hypothetical protein